MLAGLVREGALTEHDGRWHAADLGASGVPATFAEAIRWRLDGMSADARQVIGAAAVLGRRFDWALLGPVTGLADAAVVAALRDSVGLQLIVAERDSFRFRHALTHEAVLAGLLPPERAILAGGALAAARRPIQVCPARGARWPRTWPGGRATRPGPARCCSKPGGGTWPPARWPAPSAR